MSVKTHTCLTIACDICGEEYGDEYNIHFGSLAQAHEVARTSGWMITTDRKVICATQDDDHQTYVDALLPPEPTLQIPGQLAIDEPEDAA